MKANEQGPVTIQAQQAAWAAAAACAWAVLFAGLSFFWAAGGRTGLHPLEQAARSSGPWWVVLNLGAGGLKLFAGMLAVALVRTQGQQRYRRPLFVATWAQGVGIVLYGGLGLLSDALHVSGIIYDPATRHWFFWYLVLWDPWWVLGGALFIATAWLTRRRDLQAYHSLH
jgi:hypothetical protein